MKADSGKPRLSLLPWRALWAMAALLTDKAAEHEDPPDRPAWRDLDAQRYEDACARHLALALAGDASEDHWLAVAVNAAIAWERRVAGSGRRSVRRSGW